MTDRSDSKAPYTEPGWYVTWHEDWYASWDYCTANYYTSKSLAQHYDSPDGWQLFPVPEMTREIGEPQ